MFISRWCLGIYMSQIEITMCPRSQGCVLNKDGSLVVFFPEFLLSKHSARAQRAGSRFHKISTIKQMIYLVECLVLAARLHGDRVELKEVPLPSDIGTGENGVIKLNDDLKHMVRKKDVGGKSVNVLAIPTFEIPVSDKVNMVLVKYNPQFGNGIHDEFRAITGSAFETFTSVHAVLTVYPGNYAPPFEDTRFWNEHALLEPL